ncbi:hypothetical protein [Helicobacter pullorum]|uniref:hypothetical protein n=1 Tax=Helicobacter pullorum TaxID=35818 RepID=UPI000816918A|nr:hypothetical protein [Helicobacter pullorum]OCR14454.1 hypothetical protein BA916_06370 [Helicobacter pullorum]
MKAIFFTILLLANLLNAAQITNKTTKSTLANHQTHLETSKIIYPSQPRCVKMKLGAVVCFPK